MSLRLYRVLRTDERGHDEAEAFVVAAPDEASARAAPFLAWERGAGGCGGECRHVRSVLPYLGPQTPCVWRDADRSHCTLIGDAAPDVAPGIVLRSLAAP
jgi:hypothetical protein